MRRIISLSVLCVMLISLCGFTVCAEGTTISVGVATATSSNSLSVPITISGNTGFLNLGIEVEYDNTALTLTNVIPGNTGATYTAAPSITTKPYNMSWDTTTNNTFNGTLATLEFEVSDSASGQSSISVSYYKGRNGDYIDGVDVNYDENFSSLNVTYVPRSVPISNGNTSRRSISVKNVKKNNTLTFEAGLESDEMITGVAIAALYDSNGVLIAVKFNNAAMEVPFSFEDIQDAVMAKVFWWDSAGGMIPQAKSKTVNL